MIGTPDDATEGGPLAQAGGAPPADRTATAGAESLEARIFDCRAEYLAIALISLLFVLLTFQALWGAVDLYFTADAGHYAADADALLGRGVREIRHPPLFPALLAVFQPVAGDIGAFQLALAISAFLLPTSLYFLLRPSLPPVASLAGAALGAFTPPMGELFGWAGGATLIALDCMFLSLAFLERWIQNGGKQGFLLGIAVGLAALSHPFVFAATLFVVFVRWAYHALSHRSVDRGWGPLGLRGLGSAAATAGGLFILAADYYVRLRAPGQRGPSDLGLPAELLLWGVRENVFLLFFFLLGLLLPLPRMKRGLLVVIAAFAVLFVAIPLLVSWDPSYSSRVVYFLPAVFAVGGGLLVELAIEQLRASPRLRRLEAPVLVAVLVAATVGTAYGLGYVDRLAVASSYYQRIHADDLPAFEYLRSGTGTVAVSWPGAFQDEGIVNSWFVEGLSKRLAFGPGAPWLSTLTAVGSAEQDMQRLFSGSVGIENGALQLSGARTGSLVDPAINVRVAGFYYPLAYVNSYANAYPVGVVENVDPAVAGNVLVLDHATVQSGVEIIQESRLDGDAVNITYRLTGANATSGPWSIWIWPAYYRAWDDVGFDGADLRTSTPYRNAVVTTRIHALNPATVLRYFPADPRWGIQGIELAENDTSSIGVRITVEGGEPAGTVRSFDEASLLAQYRITNVLLWKDTGWEPRFDLSPRFQRTFESPRLVVYLVVP